METGFSFNYNGERLHFGTPGKHKIDGNLTVTAERKEYEKYNAAYWVIWFENTGNENTGIISDIWDCDAILELKCPPKLRPGFMPTEVNVCVTSMMGCVAGKYYNYSDTESAKEFSYSNDYLYKGRSRHSYSSLGGRSSNGTMPFFNVSADGAGAMVALGWTGGWKAEFELAENGVRIKSGIGTKTEFYLKPSEKVRTSSFLVMKYSECEDSGNKFRRLIKEHFSHTQKNQTERKGIFAFELWGGLPSETMIKRVNELSGNGIRFEDLWIDAGWYGDCTKCDEPFSGDWAEFTGDWRINKKTHPREMLDVKAEANKAGMNMMIWIEPERATYYVPMPKEHPDWYLSDGNEKHDYIINYGNPEAYKYTLDMLTYYIGKYEMGCFRQDYNTDYLVDFSARADEEGRKGLTEIKHIMGLYRLWDTLLERFPKLVIDNCASGGRRIDIETLSRTVAYFRSDYQCQFNACAEVFQTHNANISKILPLAGCTTKVKNDTYNVRSAYSPSFGCAFYNAVFQEMDEQDFKWAKKITDEYLSIREYFSCDFYNHGSDVFDKTSWGIWQYNDPENGKGIVMAFRRPNSPFETADITLKGIMGNKKLTVKNLDTNEIFEIGEKMKITLPEKRSSVIFEYTVE